MGLFKKRKKEYDQLREIWEINKIYDFNQLMDIMEVVLVSYKINFERGSYYFKVPGNEIIFRNGEEWELSKSLQRFTMKEMYPILKCLSDECYLEECYQKFVLIKCIQIVDDIKFEISTKLLQIGK